MRVLIAIAVGLVVTIGLGYGLTAYKSDLDFSGLAPKEDVAAGERIIDLIRARQFDAVREAVDPSAGQIDTAVLEKMASVFPKGVNPKARVTACNTSHRSLADFNTGGTKAADVTVIRFAYSFPKGDGALAAVIISNAGGRHSIIGAQVAPGTAEQIHGSDFQVTGLDIRRMALLALAVAIDVLSIAAFVLCLMGPDPGWRTRWLWAAFTLVGFVRLDVVWTMGELIFLPISVMLPPATLSQVPIGTPWHLCLTLPIGALVYLGRRSREGWGLRAARPA
jgi:hypothetical protein